MGKRVDLVLEFVKAKYGDLSHEAELAILLTMLNTTTVRQELFNEFGEFETEKATEAEKK